MRRARVCAEGAWAEGACVCGGRVCGGRVCVRRARVRRARVRRRGKSDERTRTWPVYAAQRVACALARAVAYAIAREFELSTAHDRRGD